MESDHLFKKIHGDTILYKRYGITIPQKSEDRKTNLDTEDSFLNELDLGTNCLSDDFEISEIAYQAPIINIAGKSQSFDEELQINLLKQDSDIIPVREGCCSYSLYDRIENQDPKKRKQKQYEKELERINKNLVNTETEIINKIKSKSFIKSQEKNAKEFKTRSSAIIKR